jgi:hypothetical protein
MRAVPGVLRGEGNASDPVSEGCQQSQPNGLSPVADATPGRDSPTSTITKYEEPRSMRG